MVTVSHCCSSVSPPIVVMALSFYVLAFGVLLIAGGPGLGDEASDVDLVALQWPADAIKSPTHPASYEVLVLMRTRRTDFLNSSAATLRWSGTVGDDVLFLKNSEHSTNIKFAVASVRHCLMDLRDTWECQGTLRIFPDVIQNTLSSSTDSRQTNELKNFVLDSTVSPELQILLSRLKKDGVSHGKWFEIRRQGFPSQTELKLARWILLFTAGFAFLVGSASFVFSSVISQLFFDVNDQVIYSRLENED